MVKNLKRLRTEAKLSQAKLAAEIGVSQQSINKYENHKIEPDISTLKKIAVYFGVTVDYLIGNDPDNTAKRHHIDLDPSEARIIDIYRKMNRNEKKWIDIIFCSYCGDTD